MLLSFTSKAESGFNPRVLTGGRDSRRIVRTEPQRGFNPRVLTGGRDFYAQLSFELQVFQSTRPRGRTRRLIREISLSNFRFNPRVLAGGRDGVKPKKIEKFLSFNPRVLAGGRDFLRNVSHWMIMFQSTRPRGRTRL